MLSFVPVPSLAALRSPPSYCTLVVKQYQGLIVKRMLYSLRHWWVTMMQFIVPILMAVCAALIINGKKAGDEADEAAKFEPALLLDTSMFVSPKVRQSFDTTV